MTHMSTLVKVPPRGWVLGPLQTALVCLKTPSDPAQKALEETHLGVL